MTTQTRIRRMSWIAALSICVVLYALLHIKVNAVHADVVRAEREIVALEIGNNLLETEFLTRSNQIQLARWNRVEFGYRAPAAEQFIGNERQLARFSVPRAEDAPPPIRLAGLSADEDTPPFPQLVSPLTGKRSARPAGGEAAELPHLAVALADSRVRVALPVTDGAGQ